MSTVNIGDPDDTAEVVTVTLTRNSGDSTSDFTSISTVVLVLPDSTTQSVTESSSTTSEWVGTVQYDAWFTTAGVYATKAKATFGDGSIMTFREQLNFSVGSA